MRCRISGSLREATEQRLRGNTDDVARLVRVIVGYAGISCPATLYSVDDDANQDDDKDCPEGGAERDQHGDAFGVATA